MINRTLTIRCLTPNDRDAHGKPLHYWVGYYDKQPWSRDHTRLLCHRAPFADRFPRAGEPCEVGFVDTTSGAFTTVASSRAWNWQQGAMAQWLPDPTDPDREHILFNDLRDGAHIAIIVDDAGNELRSLPAPVYAVSPDKRSALTLSFARLNTCRPEYGVPGLVDPNASIIAPENDGVWRMDLATGERAFLVSIADLAAHDPDPRGTSRPNHANHLMFNTTGTRFCMLHRFERPDGITQSRLFTLNLDADRAPRDLRLLMSGMVSHFDWRDDRTILAWAGHRKLLGGGGRSKSPVALAMNLARRTLKPVYYALGKPRVLMNKIVKDSYLLIPDRESAPTERYAMGELTCDGHCTYNRAGPNPGRFFVTDGYPDRGRQPLFIWDTRENLGYTVGRYDSPRQFDGDIRVDLHPRFSHDASRVCIDSAMDGSRKVYEVDVASLTLAGAH